MKLAMEERDMELDILKNEEKETNYNNTYLMKVVAAAVDSDGGSVHYVSSDSSGGESENEVDEEALTATTETPVVTTEVDYDDE
ncbi:hypothetical protein ACFL96_12355, partial [Thermoproteota archaeon]